ENSRGRLDVVDPRRYEHFGWHAGRPAVVLEHERLQDRLRILAGDVFEVEPVAVDHLPVARGDATAGRVVAVARDPEDVDRAHVPSTRRLPVGEVADRE